MSHCTEIILAIMGGELIAAVLAARALARRANRQRGQADGPGPGETTEYSSMQDD